MEEAATETYRDDRKGSRRTVVLSEDKQQGNTPPTTLRNYVTERQPRNLESSQEECSTEHEA